MGQRELIKFFKEHPKKQFTAREISIMTKQDKTVVARCLPKMAKIGWINKTNARGSYTDPIKYSYAQC